MQFLQREPKVKSEAFPGIMKKDYSSKSSSDTSKFMQRGSPAPPTMVSTPPTPAPAPAAKKTRVSKKEDPVVEQPRMTGKASKPRKLL